MDGVK